MRALACLLLLLAGSPPALAAAGEWNFRVLLDGREIGRHRFSLQDAGSATTLRSQAEFDVRLLSFSLYRYAHEAVEEWRDGCLESLEARTEANGRASAVTARAERGALAVTHPRGLDRHAGCVMSFAYWNPQILKAQRLLNSQTGEVLPVTVTQLGEETRPVGGEPRAAQRHRIQVPGLQIDLWYVDGRWVALEAPAAGGRRLRYELM
jgi:hypothetical protein